MLFHRLDWDSSFFAKEVWRLSLSEGDSVGEIRDVLQHRSNCDVVYIVHPTALLPSFVDTLKKTGACLVDERITYFKPWYVSPTQLPENVMQIDSLSPALLDLAYQSGHKSRYRLDQRFASDFERLYQRWVENALSGPNSVVYGCLGKPQELIGMAAYSVADGIGKLELLATHSRFRGQGVGTKLLQAGAVFFHNHQVSSAEVVTQGDNKGACAFYELLGYRVKSRESVWHLWTY